MADPRAAALDFVSRTEDAELFQNTEGADRVRCTMTGQDLPLNIQVLEAYWNGRAHRTAREAQFDPGDYEPWIVPSRHDSKMMYCKLTKQTMVRKKSVLDRHRAGRRFRRLLKIAQEARAGKREDKSGTSPLKRAKRANGGPLRTSSKAPRVEHEEGEDSDTQDLDHGEMSDDELEAFGWFRTKDPGD